MSWIDVFILSLIEGLTEFIPVSSTGHLILASSLLNIAASDFTKAFEVIIQFGAIFAVLLLYRERLKWNFSFYKKIAIAFLPAAIIGFLFKNKIDLLLESTTVVAIALIIGGVILVFIDSAFRHQTETEVSEKSALMIGFAQCLAMVPGVSRSAATIIGGQVAGLSRERAAEFSFLLAIPTMGAATAYKLWKVRHILDSSNALTLLLGVFLSFVFSIFAIKFFISILNRYGFRYFGIYRIIIGILVLFFSHAGAL
jgi:undecaprenyl-diphosphatase